jgi:NTE family protein
VRPPYIIRDEYNFRTEAGLPLGLHSKFDVGVAYTNSGDEYYQTNGFKQEDTPDRTSFRALVTKLGVENNSLNYKQYATEGTFRYINAFYVTGNEIHTPGSTADEKSKLKTRHDYFLVEAQSKKYFRLGRRFTLGTHVEAVFSNKDLFRNYRSTMLAAPAFTPTPHSKSLFIENFRANNYIAGGLKTIVKFNPALHMRIEAYSFLPIYEVQEMSTFSAIKKEQFIENYYLQGMAALVYQTGIGPISLALNYYEKPNTEFYLTLNFGYILFNNRGL